MSDLQEVTDLFRKAGFDYGEEPPALLEILLGQGKDQFREGLLRVVAEQANIRKWLDLEDEDTPRIEVPPFDPFEPVSYKAGEMISRKGTPLEDRPLRLIASGRVLMVQHKRNRRYPRPIGSLDFFDFGGFAHWAREMGHPFPYAGFQLDDESQFSFQAIAPTFALELPRDLFPAMFGDPKAPANPFGPIQRAWRKMLLTRYQVDCMAPDIVGSMNRHKAMDSVDDAFLYALLADARFQTVRNDETLYHQGHAADSFYYLVEGALRSRLTQRDGRGTEVQHDWTHRPGDEIGLEHLLYRRPRHTTTRSTQTSIVLRFEADAHDNLFKTEPEYRRGIINTSEKQDLDRIDRQEQILDQRPRVMLAVADLDFVATQPMSRVASMWHLFDLLGLSLHRHLWNNVLVVHVLSAREPLDPIRAAWGGHTEEDHTIHLERRYVRLDEGRSLVSFVAELVDTEAEREDVEWDVILIDPMDALINGPKGIHALFELGRMGRADRHTHKFDEVINVVHRASARVPRRFFAPDLPVLTTALLDPDPAPIGFGHAIFNAGKTMRKRESLRWRLRKASKQVVTGAQDAWKFRTAQISDKLRDVDHLVHEDNRRTVWPRRTCRLRLDDTLDQLHDHPEPLDFEDEANVLSDQDTERFDRWARAVMGIGVGVALGGGGAWGYVCIPLLEELQKREIPIDLIAGTSAGNNLGSFFAARGMEGLELAMAHRFFIALLVPSALVSMGPMEAYFNFDLGYTDLRDLEIPIIPTATNVDRGEERGIRTGRIGRGVRLSGGMPPMAPTILGTTSFVDGALAANVPIRALRDEAMGLIIACNPIPPPSIRVPRGLYRIPVAAQILRPLDVIQRSGDLWRSFLMLLKAAGENQQFGDDTIVYGAVPPSDVFVMDVIGAKRVVEAGRGSEALQRTVGEVVNLWHRNKGHPPPRVKWDYVGDNRNKQLFVEAWCNFEPQSSNMSQGSILVLREIAEYLVRQTWILRIRCEAWCNDFDESENLKVAQQRAEFLARQLESYGVAPARLERPKGHSGYEPNVHGLKSMAEDRTRDMAFVITAGDPNAARSPDAIAKALRQQQARADALHLVQGAERHNHDGDLELGELLALEAAYLNRGDPVVDHVLRLALHRRGRPHWRSTADDCQVTAVAWTANGSHVAVGDNQGRVRIFTRDGEESVARRIELDHDRVIEDLAWSAEGDLIVCAFWELRVYRMRLAEEGGVPNVRAAGGVDTWNVWGVGYRGSADRMVGPRGQGQTLSTWTGGSDSFRELSGGAEGRITSADVSTDGRYAAAGRAGGTVSVWDLESEAWTKDVSLEGDVLQVSFRPDATQAAIIAGGAVHVIDLVGRKKRRDLVPADALARTVAWSSDGTQLAVGTKRGQLSVWSFSGRGEPQLVMRLRAHQTSVAGLAFRPDSDGKLVSWGRDSRAVLWDTETGAREVTVAGHRGDIRAVAWTPDGELLATGGLDGSCVVWEVDRTGAQVLAGHQGPAQDLCWPAGGRLFSAGHDGQVLCFGGPDSTDTTPLIPGSKSRKKASASRVAVAPDGRLAIASLADGAIHLHAPSGEHDRKLGLKVDRLGPMRFTPDGKVLLVGNAGPGVTAVSIDDDAVHEFSSNPTGADGPDGVKDIAVHPDKPEVFAVASWLQRGSAMVYDLSRPDRAPVVLEGHRDGVWQLSWSAGGRFLATACNDGSARIFDGDTLELLETLAPQSHGFVNCTTVAFHPTDPSLLLVGDSSRLVRRVVYLPDAKNPEDRLTTTSSTAHRSAIQKIAWAPDGSKWVSTSSGSTARVWLLDDIDLKTPMVLTSPSGPIDHARFSEDSTRLATVDRSGEVRFHIVDHDLLVQRVGELALGKLESRSLTEDQWIEFFGPDRIGEYRHTWPRPEVD